MQMGTTWDEVVEPDAELEDICEETIKIFKRSVKASGRFPDLTELGPLEVIEKLNLLKNGQFKRAAIILFGKNPQKFYPQSYLKIGRFGEKDHDLLHQDIIEGNLIDILNTSLEVLEKKYLKMNIRIEGIHRIETLEYPREALREMILNALVHRNYFGAFTQLRVHDEKLSIWNYGGLPDDLTIEKLKTNHRSVPRNPLIASACFKAGYIDTWGRGTIKIIDLAKESGLKEAELFEDFGGFEVTLHKKLATPLATPQVEQLLSKILGEMKRNELMEALGIKDREYFRSDFLKAAINEGYIEMTDPTKPNSPNQKYRLSDKGRKYLEEKGKYSD